MVAVPRSLCFVSLVLCCGLAAHARSLRSKLDRLRIDPEPEDLDVVKTAEDDEAPEDPDDINVAAPTTTPDISYLDNDTGAFSSVVFQFKETIAVYPAVYLDFSTQHLFPFHEYGTDLHLCAVIRNRTLLVEWLKMHADLDTPLMGAPDTNDGFQPPQVLSGGCDISANNAGFAHSLHIHLVDACIDGEECAVEYNLVNDTLAQLLDRSAEAATQALPDEFPVKPSNAVIRALYVKHFTNDVKVPMMLNELDIKNDSSEEKFNDALINGSFASTGDGLAALQMLLDSPDPDSHAEFTVHGPVLVREEKVATPDISICMEDFLHPQSDTGLQGNIDHYIMRGAPSVVRSLQLAEDSVKEVTCEDRGFTIGPFGDRCNHGGRVRFYIDALSYKNWNKTMGAVEIMNSDYAPHWETMESCLEVFDRPCDMDLWLEELITPYESLAGKQSICIWSEEEAASIDRLEEALEQQDIIRGEKDEEYQRKVDLENEKRQRQWLGIDDEEFDETDAKPEEEAVGEPAEDPVIEVEEDPDFLDGLEPASR